MVMTLALLLSGISVIVASIPFVILARRRRAEAKRRREELLAWDCFKKGIHR